MQGIHKHFPSNLMSCRKLLLLGFQLRLLNYTVSNMSKYWARFLYSLVQKGAVLLISSFPLCSHKDETANTSVTVRSGLASKGPRQPHEAAKQREKVRSLPQTIHKNLELIANRIKAQSTTTKAKI